MDGERKSLNFEELEGFSPRPKPSFPQGGHTKDIDNVSVFPSRERMDEAQMNIKASNAVVNRFRHLARKERYRHGEFLEILMNAYEGV